MASILGFTGIVITTLIALSAALALHWALLNGVFLLMRPATAQRLDPLQFERGTRLAAHAYARARRLNRAAQEILRSARNRNGAAVAPARPSAPNERTKGNTPCLL